MFFALEKIRQFVLSSEQPNIYKRYRCEGQSLDDVAKQLTFYPGVQPTGWIYKLYDVVLHCVRSVHGPVALYWLVPLLYAMYGDRLQLWDHEGRPKVKKLERLQCREAPKRALCEKLPLGCDVVHQLAHASFDAGAPPRFILSNEARRDIFKPLIVYYAKFLCATIEHQKDYFNPTTTTAFRRTNAAEDATARLTADGVLHLLSAGSVPLAMAVVETQNPMVLRLLCSATGTHGGTFLLRALRSVLRVARAGGRNQREAPPNGIVWTKSGANAAFFAKFGFVDAGHQMMWRGEGHRPQKRQRT